MREYTVATPKYPYITVKFIRNSVYKYEVSEDDSEYDSRYTKGSEIIHISKGAMMAAKHINEIITDGDAFITNSNSDKYRWHKLYSPTFNNDVVIIRTGFVERRYGQDLYKRCHTLDLGQVALFTVEGKFVRIYDEKTLKALYQGDYHYGL